MTQSLGQLFDDASRGVFPSADGTVDVLPAPDRVAAAIFSFSAHLVVATGVAASEVHARAHPDDFASWGSVAPWLAERAGATELSGDVLLCGIGGGIARPDVDLDLVEEGEIEHPRVARATRYRDDVVVYVTRDRDGVLVLGRGIAGRHEVAFEVEPHARNGGLGRALVESALAIVAEGEAVWAQVHPGNAASLRTVLAAGFTPIGYEQLVV
ncbi:MAG: family N-acetyltransferase [Actinomycetia bacterium]|nr:family N-acetyltransferase [Actinomycetes bacterium]